MIQSMGSTTWHRRTTHLPLFISYQPTKTYLSLNPLPRHYLTYLSTYQCNTVISTSVLWFSGITKDFLKRHKTSFFALFWNRKLHIIKGQLNIAHFKSLFKGFNLIFDTPYFKYVFKGLFENFKYTILPILSCFWLIVRPLVTVHITSWSNHSQREYQNS